MRLAAVITCVGYGDILAHTLCHNRHQFHYTVVATTPDDIQTRKICEYWNAHCVVVPEFREGGGFRKGAGINAGIAALKQAGFADGWVVHMDADILLPPLAGELIGRANLDPTSLYGIDRHMIRSFEDWCDHLSHPRLQHENRVYVHVDRYPIGTRIAPHDHYAGYVPIGFFQMWNPTVSGVWEYPAQHTDAGRGDMLFAKNWPRCRRGMIPEVIGYHLESEPAPMGTNWGGRKTKLFGPTRVPPPVPRPFMGDDEVEAVGAALLRAAGLGGAVSVLEWGAGGSTCHFPAELAAKGVKVDWTSIEHDPLWVDKVRESAPAGVAVHYVGTATDKPLGWVKYIDPACAAGRKYDAILVDGRMRRRCLLKAKQLLRADDSVVILHDAERPYYRPAIAGGNFVLPRVWVGTRGDIVDGSQ